MKKLYSFGKWNLFSIVAFLVMMAGFQMGALAQSAEDCISGAVPVRTYLFFVTEDDGATYNTVAEKNIKDGQVVPRPEFVGVEYSTFKSWYTVTDPAAFSVENKFDETNFSTPQTVTVTDTVRLYASLKADVFHVIFMEGVGSDARVFRVWERVAGTPNLNPDNEQVIVDATTKSVGWYYDQALTQRATTFTMPAHDTTLYPDIKTGKWVYYVSNGGTYVEPDFYQIEETTQIPDNPTRVGYTFVGWDNGADAWYRTDGSVDQFGSTLTESITLDAVWTPNEVAYTVVYWVENADDEDYSVNNIRTATALAGDHITALESGYTSYDNILDGLDQHVTSFSYDRNTQVSSTDVTVAGDGSTVINIYYKRKSYTLTFNPNRVYNSLLFTSTAFCNWYNLTFCLGTGQPSEVITAKYGANIWDRFPINRFYGQEWGGAASTSMWRATNANVYNYALQTISTMPGSDVTFYLYVNFNVGDSPNMIYYDLENIEGGFDRKEVPTYFQFITYGEEYCDIQGFSKQTEAEAGFNTSTHRKDFNSDHTVTLLYFRNSYDLRFFNGGTELTSMAQTRKYGQVIDELASLSDADAPAGKEGFSFGGWYANELCEGDPIDFTSTMPAADVILYAKWIAPDYTVRIHHTTTGSGEYTDVTVPYGQTVSGTDLESVHPCAGGTNAYGWKILNDDESMSAFATDMQVYRDLALVPFCLLSGEEYTITYDMNCAGAAAVEDDHIYADGANPMVQAPSVEACEENIFLGWVDASNILHYPGNGIYMTENKTLTALWGSGTEHTEVSMVENHPTTGTQTASLDIVTNGTTPLNLPENFERPERPNDLFLGWSTTENATMPEYAPGESVVLSCNVSVYPVWMQIVPDATIPTLCPGIDVDLKDFLAYNVENDAYTFGTADNIQSFTWEVTKDGAEFTDHTDLVVTNIQPGVYVVNLTLTTTKGVEYPLTTTVNVTGTNIDPVFPSLQTTICQGYSVDLPMGSEEISATETDPAIPSVMGAWMYADGLGSITEVTRVPTEDEGNVTITFVPDAGQCANDANIIFTIVAPPTVTITGESMICDGSSISLTANVDPATSATYQWFEFAEADKWREITGATGTTLDVSDASSYLVEVTTADGCIVNSGEFEVTAAATPVITVTGETEITYGESVNITVSCANGTLSAPDAADIPTGLAVDATSNPNEMVISGTPNANTYNLVFTGTSDCGNVTETVVITVNPLDVTVTVIGEQNTATYDGDWHTVASWDISADNSLYNLENDISYYCNPYASQQDVGTTEMSLSDGCFENINPNFNVSFDVTDGYQEITPAEMTIVVTGATETKVYTGADFNVSGYTLSCDNTLYDEALVTFTGDDFVTASSIGTHPMGLAADQFSYGNDNIDVTFDVTDGWLLITAPGEVVVTITGHTATATYDGDEHFASGYDVSISNPS
ncbi:MAG: InlB B-repeat-containing protein, partial [Bacteroidales bacterium]|nr:InlB B-repeat-containing protein [Bacteroidales bacterium]